MYITSYLKRSSTEIFSSTHEIKLDKRLANCYNTYMLLNKGDKDA